jgi:hypothetical protein
MLDGCRFHLENQIITIFNIAKISYRLPVKSALLAQLMAAAQGYPSTSKASAAFLTMLLKALAVFFGKSISVFTVRSLPIPVSGP